jgi:hypothetical protein
MMTPTNMTPEEIVVERDSYRETLQRMIRERESFTETELSELKAVGVSFDAMTKQLQWTPMNGTDRLVAEWSAYHHAILALMGPPAWTPTREDLEDMEKNGVTSEQLMAEVDEMIRRFHQGRNGQ